MSTIKENMKAYAKDIYEASEDERIRLYDYPCD